MANEVDAFAVAPPLRHVLPPTLQVCRASWCYIDVSFDSLYI